MDQVEQTATNEIVYQKYSNEEIMQKETELETLKSELQIKQYLVFNDKKLVNDLLYWLTNDVSWSYTESIGVVKLVDEFNEVFADKSEKQLYLTMGAVTAINYLLQKVTGKGYKEALKIRNFVMPILEVLNGSIKKDTELVQKLEFELASMREGIRPDLEEVSEDTI